MDMEKSDNNNISETEKGKKTEKEKKKSSLTKRIFRIAAWVIASPMLLVLLLILLLYIPPVQQFAVDKATEILSEQMGMDVKVGEVRLKFPLDLSLRNMTAVEKGDTVLDAKELTVSIRVMPLLKQEVEVDGVSLKSAKVSTMDLIEACRLEGTLGEFTLNSHTTSLKNSEAVVSYALLADTDLKVVLADSVSEDTTEASEPLDWKILLKDVQMKNVALDLALAPQSDSVRIGALIGNASVKGLLDLGKETYEVTKLAIGGTKVTYTIGDRQPVKGIDPNNIVLTDIALDVDSARFCTKTGEMGMTLNQFVAKERSGLEIVETHTRVTMNSKSLNVSDLLLKTRHSKIAADVVMDLNAFDEKAPGKLHVDANAMVGWGDIDKAMPMEGVWNKMTAPLTLTMKADGNMKRMEVGNIEAAMMGAFNVKGRAVATDLTDSLLMGAKARLRADIMNIDFVKGMMPAETASSFKIPKNMLLLADVGLQEGKVSADANLHAADALIMLTANYGLYSETYKADLDISNFVLNKIMPLEEKLDITGSISAEGRGFDIYSPTMWADATLLLDTARMGKIDVSGTNASLKFEHGHLDMTMACNNHLLQTDFDLSGDISKAEVKADLNIDLPFADFKAMGLSESTLEMTTNGRASMVYNWNDLFLIDSYIKGLDMKIGKESVVTEDFYIYAESMPDSTAATIRTGDLSFDFHSPNNLFSLIEIGQEVGDMAMKQVEEKKLDLELLKSHMPVADLRTSVGPENPVTKVLATNGIKFDNIKANVQTSPESGLTGWAHVYGLQTDSIQVDTAYFSIVQDTTAIVYKAGVRCDDQKLCPGFSAILNGHISLEDADAHITYLNKKGMTGVDLGVKASFGDSLTHFTLYPAQPIIAFSKFDINADNFVTIDKAGRIFADVLLESQKDSCRIALTANPEDDRQQDARAVITSLNMGELLTVVPFMPKMDGMINLDANYVQTAENFSVDGEVEVNTFKYEGAKVGDLKAQFDYAPVGTTGHDVKAVLSHNNIEVADVEGHYNAENEGHLDALLKLKDLPMSMASAFVPDQIVTFGGNVAGELKAQGAIDKLAFEGNILPKGVRMKSEVYALDMRFADTPIVIDNSRLTFDKFEMFGAGENPLTLNGYVDFSDFEELMLNLSLYGRNFQLIDAQRTRKSVIFGKMFGDFFARVNGTTNDLSVRGMVSVLNNTDMTYVMADTPLSIDYRLEDIVTFVDFSAPPDTTSEREARTFMGMDMRIQLMVEDGAQFHCEFSADRQSYVNVQGGGSLVMTYTPEGVLNLQGRYTVNEGEMKYTLPVIPLKTFTIHNGSYIDFTGDPMNPTLNISASERTKASVSSADGSSRSVAFDVGLKVTNTLSNMGLEFTIESPEDLTVQNELAGMSLEEKNKLAVAMLATGMYLSSSNSSGFSASNALNNFLQNEINNIAGQALNTAVDVNVGLEQSTRDDGSTRTDYSFKFSKRFFSDRLNIVIGGKISADGNKTENESGAYIDDVSLEWRLDNGGTRYVRLFHEKNYDNLIEGELIENGAGVVLRKKLDRLSELFIFKRNKQTPAPVVRENNKNQ